MNTTKTPLEAAMEAALEEACSPQDEARLQALFKAAQSSERACIKSMLEKASLKARIKAKWLQFTGVIPAVRLLAVQRAESRLDFHTLQKRVEKLEAAQKSEPATQPAPTHDNSNATN